MNTFDRIRDLEKALEEMTAEYHAAINEPTYSGTRRDWMARALAAEAGRSSASVPAAHGDAVLRAALFRLTTWSHDCAMKTPEFCVPCIAQRALDEASAPAGEKR